MIIGVPREIKSDENRVALVPVGAQELVRAGHTVLVQRGAGEGSSFADAAYEEAGAKMVEGPEGVFREAQMIVKVKEPLPSEFRQIRQDQIVFTYFHFAADEALLTAMRNSGCIALAYETVQLPSGSLPLLVPMSEVAGRMAVQEGAKYLERAMGGEGVLLGGVPGVMPATVVIIGGGVVGTNAAKMASGMGARVILLEVNLERLRYLDDVMPKNVFLLHSNPHTLREALREADLVVGAVLLAGAKAPKLVTREDLKCMKRGAVVVDVSVDQGGCIETAHPTTHSNPTYVVEGVVHYCVANMPGAVPRTSTLALTNATFPYVKEVADRGWKAACRESPAMRQGLNVVAGQVTHPGVAAAFGLTYTPPDRFLQ